jgi:uncharacterized repeat protein (TIGR01451 family)
MKRASRGPVAGGGGVPPAVDGDVIDATGITGTILLQPIEFEVLLVLTSITILGPGPDQLTVDGNRTNRVFAISPGLSVEIDGFTIANGLSVSGGGILNLGSFLTVRNCIVRGNSSSMRGGGIHNDGSFSGAATLLVVGSSFIGNSAGETDTSSTSGGAILNDGTDGGNAHATVIDCTISGNSALGPNGTGAGIANMSSGDAGIAALTIVNSTVSGNSAPGVIGSGGAVRNSASDSSTATVLLAASTLSGNSAFAGGGIQNDGSDATIVIGNCILRAGLGGNIRNILGEVVSLGFNISSDAGVENSSGGTGELAAPGDQINTDPMLGPLADNGGPTLTHLPLTGSPAIDQGSSDSLIAFELDTDQRGFARTVDDPVIANATLGDGTDIGAVEVGGTAPPPPVDQADLLVSLGVDKTGVKQGELLTYTITVLNFGPDAAANVVVNDTLSSGTTFVSANANKGSFTAPPKNQTGVVTWSLGDMDNGDTEAAELVVTVIVKGKTTVTNTATAVSDSEDPNPGNNTASITTSVGAGGGTGGGKKK